MIEEDAWNMFFGVGAVIGIMCVQQIGVFMRGQHINMLLCASLILSFVVLCMFMVGLLWDSEKTSLPLQRNT
jgi:NADH:ubiquinone oxidoreductase subunit K